MRNMRGGCKKFLAIESKLFDLSVVGTKEDILKISENGRGRRFSILLPEEVVLWLLRAWTRFRKSKSANWCNQMRLGSRIFMLESRSNRARKYLLLSVIIDGKRSFVIFPAGWNEWGWFKMFGFIAEIVGLIPLDPSIQPRSPPNPHPLWLMPSFLLPLLPRLGVVPSADSRENQLHFLGLMLIRIFLSCEER